jgi:putative transcriptional regulator
MKTSKAKPGARPRRKGAERRAGRSSSAGTKILAAIEEATELLRSEGLSGKRLTVRAYKCAPALRSYTPGDVVRVRELLGTSQAVLARFLGVNVNTIRSWEQGKRLPQPIACRFLAEIETDPAYWRRRIGQEDFEIEPRKSNGRERALQSWVMVRADCPST